MPDCHYWNVRRWRQRVRNIFRVIFGIRLWWLNISSSLANNIFVSDGICPFAGYCCSKWGWCGKSASICSSFPISMKQHFFSHDAHSPPSSLLNIFYFPWQVQLLSTAKKIQMLLLPVSLTERHRPQLIRSMQANVR